MANIIAKCGINCSECNAYKATITNSEDLRKKTAQEWSALFGVVIDPKTISCLGCQESDKNKLFSHCQVCGIRTCAVEKGFKTCAECDDFGCEKVASIWQHDSKIKANLDSLRA